jgi:hypothetical protein
MSELGSANASGNLDRKYCRNLEPCDDQYGDSGNNRLHVYTGCRTVRNDSNFECDDNDADHANICYNRTIMSELGSASASGNIHRKYFRNLEPGDDLDNYCRNNGLHVHASCRTVRSDSNFKRDHHHTDHTDLCCDRTALSRINRASFTSNINRKYHWNLESGNDLNSNSGHNRVYLYA